MKRIIHSTCIARLVLAWFVAFIGVSVAAPAFSPMSVQLICSTSSSTKLINVDVGNSGVVQHGIGMHCALCPPLAGTFPVEGIPDLHLSAFEHVLRAPKLTELVSAEALNPLSRGPPFYT